MSALATVFSWRTQAWLHVSAGVSSWQAGLALGFLDHLQWGPQVVFTFGPYGFVEDIVPFSRLTAGLALVYTLAITWGLAALIVSALRRPWGLLPAGLVAWAALSIAGNLLEAPELALATALGLTLASFRASTPGRRLALLGALGALAGFQLLVEINVGLVTTALLALGVAGGHGRAPEEAPTEEKRSPWSREVLVAGTAFVAVPLLALLAAGQNVGDFGSYVHGSLSVALGYASAMSFSKGRRAEDWYALVDVALLAAIFALAARGRPRLEKVAIFLVLVGWVWEALKEGFVRHDTHDLTFFALMLVALCLARLPRSLVPLQASAIAIAALLACFANARPPASVRSPVEGVKALEQEVVDLTWPGRWPKIEQGARNQLRSTGDDLPAALVSTLDGKTVAVDNMEDGMTFVYPQLRWDPEPVLQSYSAYTSYLDALDAGFLSSARAPERILYQAVTINNRNAFWDAPAGVEAMFCHYAEVQTTDHWLVLTKVANRCGRPQALGQATAHFGQTVTVPRVPGKMVLAEFSLSSPLTSKAEGVLLKSPEVSLTAWGPDGETTYRFLPGTAADLHILAAAASLGYPSKFAPPSVRKLEVSGGGWATGQGSVHIRFYAVSIKPR